MQKSYEEILLDASISYDEIISRLHMPQYLYKYQCFYSPKMVENKHWRDNLRGTFHLSLGKEFEDQNDCKPYINKTEVCHSIKKFLSNFGVAQKEIQNILLGLDNVLTKEYFEGVTSNYQSEIRVGCFTASSDNNDLWKKYSNDETGYCLEYKTSKSHLFKHSTLPVLYSDQPYNSSLTLANALILEAVQQGKNRTLPDQLAIYESVYAKIAKTAYVPLFIKEMNKWSFEEEYRLFLLKTRNTSIGLLKAEDFLDAKANINLSSAITTIYLGKRFNANANYKILKEEIGCIANEMGIRVVQKQ